MRYRLHSQLPGKPDIIFPKYKIVLFINGCFWHKHIGCKNFVVPKTNTVFWETKINGNVERDCINNKKLIELGWKPEIIWECEVEKDIVISTQNLIQQFKI